MDDDFRSALASLPAPPPATEAFWTDLHRQLLAEARRSPDAASPAADVELSGASPRRRRSNAVAVLIAAALVLLVAGLVWLERREAVRPIAPTPGSGQPQQTPVVSTRTSETAVEAVSRESGRITDLQSIDLDPYLDGAPTWPPTSGGPYLVFDMASLPTGWIVVDVGGGTSIPGFGWPATWSWAAQLTSPGGTDFTLELAQRGARDTPYADPTVPTQVRGHDGFVVGGSRIVWDETEMVVGSLVAHDDGDHEAEEAVLLAALTTSTVDRLPTGGLGGISVPEPAASSIDLSGTISGRRWWAQVTDTAPMGMLVGVDGWSNAGGFGPAGSAATSVADLELSVSGVPGGVLVYGFTPPTVERIRVELSDATTVELPVHTWDGGSAFVAPIPDGLDAIAIAYLDASSVVLHRTLLPEFAIPTTGGGGGGSPFGDPSGTTITGDHTPYDNVPIDASDPNDQTRSTTNDTTEPANTMPSALTTPGGHHALAFGDSVMAAAVEPLSDVGFATAIDKSIQGAGMIDSIAINVEYARDFDTVVVQVGTNGPVTQAQYDEMANLLADVPHVYFLTVKAPKDWIDPNNELIRALPTRHPNVTVIDWQARSAEIAPELSAGDGGIHLATPTAAHFFADMIIDAVDAAG